MQTSHFTLAGFLAARGLRAALLCAALIAGVPGARAGTIPARQTLLHRYVVVLKDEAAGPRGANSRAAQIAAALQAAYGGRIQCVYRYALNGLAIDATPQAALALSRDRRVARVEEDARVFAAATRSRPPFRDSDPNAAPPETGSSALTGAGVHVYVLDTGIRYSHQEFGGRASFGYDAFGGDGGDGNGHGTHVAGVIGGSTYGRSDRVLLHSVRVLDNAGAGTTSTVIAGLDWVTARHVKPAVASISLSGEPSGVLDMAVRNCIAAGVTCVVAAGNEADDARNYSPARVSEAITVGATDRYGQRAWFSNRGPVVDVYAPGVEILSAWIGGDAATATLTGTSAAAAYMAGKAALYLEEHPDATPEEVERCICVADVYP